MRPSKDKKQLYYVVWSGRKPGIYTSWNETQQQIVGTKKPKFKSFGSKELAEKAFQEGPENYEGRSFKKARDLSAAEKKRIGDPNLMSLSVDAACNAKTGVFEYQGVITESGTQVFHAGPFKNGTNNIGEFLALVHALAWLKENRSDLPIYSDSKYAMVWVRNKKANSKVTHPKTLALINRAEKWLRANNYDNQIMKWETKAWGDIPADFNRK
ncbi:MAG: ribonuclease H family protein [Bacteroidota bacterium]